jgi:glycosyltransferase involved in cell wall biosynthesis
VEEKVSAVLIAQDEEKRIGAALDSVAWADERLVVDGGSRDGTIQICQARGARVVDHLFTSYAEQKNFALDQAANNWVLSLDADEKCSDLLCDEIQALRRAGFEVDGYRIPRVNFYLGRYVRSTAWYPDHQLRLFDRRKCRWVGKYVHESVRVEGSVGKLRGEILHHSYEDVNDHLERLNHYAELAARQMREAGRKGSLTSALVLPPLVFLKNYIAKRGFTDGAVGLVVSSMNSFYVYLKLIKLWELEKKSRSESSIKSDKEEHW